MQCGIGTRLGHDLGRWVERDGHAVAVSETGTSVSKLVEQTARLDG
jgi:hypothetical protein